MEIKIKAYAYTIDIITEIRYFCKCNNAVFGKFRIIFTCAIPKTDCSLHHSFHALFKISGNGKFVRTVVLPPYPSRNLRKSTPRPRPAPLHQPSQNRTIPRLALNLPPLSKVKCCRPKEFGRLPEGLLHRSFQNRTIPRLAPHSCHMNALLVSHPCLKLWAFNFGHPYPSLVKGEVLSPERIRATTGRIAFLPHPFRFSDTSVNNPSIVGSASHCNRSSPLHKGAKGDSDLPTIPKLHYPLPRTTTLASLVKGRWIDGKPQTVALLRFACDTSAFLIYQTFRRQDGGVASSPSLACTNPKCYTKTGHKGHKGKVYNKLIPIACFGNGDSVLYIGFTLSIYQHRQQAQRFRVRDYPNSQAYIRRPKFPLFRRCRQASAYSCYRLPCRLRSACRCLYGR